MEMKNEKNEALISNETGHSGPIVPRCLSALPADIEDLIEQFKKQGE